MCSFVISQEKSADISTRRKRSKLSDGQISRDVYPKECNLCNKYRIMRKGKYIFPVTISTQQAANTIKDAAEAKEDKKLLFEIKDLDLTAKEFTYHDACYREYSLFILVMCILLQSISNPRDFVKYISGNMSL